MMKNFMRFLAVFSLVAGMYALPTVSEAAQSADAKAPAAVQQAAQVEVFTADEGVTYVTRKLNKGNFSYSYPEFTMPGKEAIAQKINAQIAQEVEKEQKKLGDMTGDDGGRSQQIYEVCFSGKKYLSVKFTRKTQSFDNKVNAQRVCGRTFRLSDGAIVAWQDVVIGNDKEFFADTKKMDALIKDMYIRTHEELLKNFQRLNRFPDNFFLDDQHMINFIFTPEELGANAVRDIFINSGRFSNEKVDRY